MTVLFSSWLLIVWAGGLDELSRVTSSAGSFAPLVILSGLVELAFLALMVCHISTGRVVPLAVMLGMATLPWTVGLLGSEIIVGRALAKLGALEASDAHSALALGVGQAMASRMLGAWMSASLLIGLGLGLAIAGAAAEGPWRSTHRGSTASLLFGVLMAFALAAIALVGALEAHQLFALLTRLSQAPLAERVSLVSSTAEGLPDLRPVRHTCLALLTTLGVALLAWQARRGARPARGWMGSIFLVAAVSALLALDAHPLRAATEGARSAGLGPLPLPANFEALAAPRTSRSLPLAALATPEAITPVRGAPLPWSTPAKELAHSLSASLRSSAQASSVTHATPEPALLLLADARLPASSVRRIAEAGELAGARSVELVGKHPHAASSAALGQLESQLPLLPMLVDRPGTRRLLLPSALANGALLSWHARLERGGTLSLYRANSRDIPTFTLSLHATPAEVPDVLAGTFVGLELSEESSLREVSAAAEVLGLAGASPVLLTDPNSYRAWPADGGTDTLWISPRPGPLAPGLIHQVVNVRRLALEVFQKAEETRHARESPNARPLETAQSSQTSNTIAAMIPTPNTTSITTPSNLDDWGALGAAFRPGSSAGEEGAGSAASRGRSAEWVMMEASRSSRPSRASASTRFMWRM